VDFPVVIFTLPEMVTKVEYKNNERINYVAQKLKSYKISYSL